MELAIPEVLDGADVSAAADAFHEAVADDPAALTAVHGGPMREVGPIKEDNRHRRVAGRLLRGAGGRGLHDRRQWVIAVVGEPAWIGLRLRLERE
jgi:hypothetical protein